MDRKGFEFKSGHCCANQYRNIKDINEGLGSDGKNLKRPTPEMQDRLWRTDPYDGLRPFIKIRKNGQKDIIIIQARIGSLGYLEKF